ncbi:MULTISPECIES: sigma-70 family RNA polymerase sigma factor [Anoxybacillus]|uniref:RNA polymerase sigma factor sigV n=1 Tax=Anoxybacillus ayderensis TaxID=265546 RepID=A0A0D0G5Y6_9BACL|nr:MULTISPECIES: sigma-70 family RNA polymerase sigma factor [Anoxybacillus]EPZ38884.1 DNA-directed RNA polymerase specialized sigma subunit [Anoxybacillus ayderensis]KHF29498.1 ECF RNA polymerase sigma factor SigE [Anoxybacillus sp. BCO1]KIP20765.1 RNA polymerase sigma factor sigV [Anoxybacillus ayderensis]NNU97147.1 sigma-70 family RNA polymerase sigma factor [Anoxybacillus sp. EFIL]
MCTKEQIQRAMDEYGNMVLRLAYTYMRNEHDAEDVFQDVFIKLYEHMDRIQSEEHMKAWLIRVTANVCKNKLKWFAYRKVDAYEEWLHSSDVDANDYFEVMSAVTSLPTKYREVVHLFYYEGYQTKEIAELLKKRESTVRSLLARAREMLKNKLKGEYDFA